MITVENADIDVNVFDLMDMYRLEREMFFELNKRLPDKTDMLFFDYAMDSYCVGEV